MRYVRYALAAVAGAAVGALVASILGVSPRPSLLPALVGIAGVIIGALTAAGSQVWLFERRRDDDAARTLHERQTANRRAARLVEADLRIVRAALNVATGGDALRPGALSALPREGLLDNWMQYQGVLAEAIGSDDDWITVALAVRTAHFFLETPAPAELKSEDAETLQGWVTRIEKGCETLARVIASSS